MSARDVVLIGVILFSVAMGLFVIHFAGTTIVNNMLSVGVVNESEGAVTALGSITEAVNRLDYIVFAVFIGLLLGLIITGWFIGGNPMFMFIYFLVSVIGVIISMVLANVWEDVSGASVFGTTVSNFPLANNLMLYLPVYVAVAGFIGIVVMFGKPYFGQNE
tara:strand:+ start:1808 stop:2293 length:486 start_codon:yes stop_codon:yes gene_type:complete